MNKYQKILVGIALILVIIFLYEWQQSRKADAIPKQLVKDINDHVFGGMPRADLEPWLSRRGGDVSFDPTPGPGNSASADHAVFRNIRHIGDRRQDLRGDFYYDQGDHLVYFVLHRVWEKPAR